MYSMEGIGVEESNSPRYCGYCGAKRRSGIAFCESCGAKLASGSEEPIQPPSTSNVGETPSNSGNVNPIVWLLVPVAVLSVVLLFFILESTGFLFAVLFFLIPVLIAVGGVHLLVKYGK